MPPDHPDEPCSQKLADCEGMKFVPILKAGVKLDETEEEKKRYSPITDMHRPLTEWWKDKRTDLTVKGAIKDTTRLTESPVVVVTPQFDCSAQQEKIMKAQAFQNKDQLSMEAGRKTLEVNANHPVFINFLSTV